MEHRAPEPFGLRSYGCSGSNPYTTFLDATEVAAFSGGPSSLIRYPCRLGYIPSADRERVIRAGQPDQDPGALS